MFLEAISALTVLNKLDMHINSLGKNLALNWLVYNYANSMLGSVDSPGIAIVNLWAFLFEQDPFPWYLKYHTSCRFACLWPKEKLVV